MTKKKKVETKYLDSQRQFFNPIRRERKFDFLEHLGIVFTYTRIRYNLKHQELMFLFELHAQPFNKITRQQLNYLGYGYNAYTVRRVNYLIQNGWLQDYRSANPRGRVKKNFTIFAVTRKTHNVINNVYHMLGLVLKIPTSEHKRSVYANKFKNKKYIHKIQAFNQAVEENLKNKCLEEVKYR